MRIQRIIDTATEFFHQKGYRATTLEDVADEIGITKAALYHYVSSKENLLSIIYIKALESIFKNTNKIAEMNLPPDEKMRLIIRNHVKNISIKSLSILSVFFAEENQLSLADFKKIQAEKKKYNQILEQIIQEGIEQKIFRDTDLNLQTYGILGACNWIYKWYKAEHTPYTPEQIAEHIIKLLERGYLAPAGSDTQAIEGEEQVEVIMQKNGSEKKRVLGELRAQCRILIDLIDKIEHREEGNLLQ